MKRLAYLLPLLLAFFFYSDIATATPSLPAIDVVDWMADEGGHGDEEDSHSDDEDDHGDEEDSHGGADDGHSNDDGHHDGPFTFASLIPLFAGIGMAVVVSGAASTMSAASLSATDLGIVALTTATGVLHLLLGGGGELLLLLNGIGYLGLLALLYLPIPAVASLKPALRIVLVLYTAVTFIAYFALHSVAQFDALGILSKLIEALLIGLLVMQIVRSSADNNVGA